MKRFFLAFLLVSIFCFSVNAQFVQVKSVNADIRVRVLPESESKIVCEALKGDIFRYKNQENEWIEIEMFSGDPSASLLNSRNVF